MSDTPLNINESLEQIDKDIELQRLYIKRAEALESLKTDERFNLVIMDGYLKEEQDRLFENLMNPYLKKIEDEELIKEKMRGVKGLKEYLGTSKYEGDGQYIGTVQNLANRAHDEIKALEDHKASLLQGEIDGTN